MKLHAVLLFCLLAGLSGYAQKVTLSAKNAKLETVLKQIKRQTGYSFFYNEAILNKSEKVTLSLKDTELPEALKECFSQQPALIYRVVGNTVVIDLKKVITTQSNAAIAENTEGANEGITVSGTVFNSSNERLENASIVVRGTQRGTTTKANGTFTLNNVKPEDFLRVSFIGYKTIDVPVLATAEKVIYLESATNQLDEVVAQGYGKTTQRLATSAINKITAAEIERQPVMNPLLALQGKVPGMTLTPLNGYASAPIKIQIKGQSDISGRLDNPLIVLDGTPLMVAANVSDGSILGEGPVSGLMTFFSPASSQNPLFGLNTRDIESIEILKDAGSTAIYGSRGANGVILINTKKGRAGPPQTSVNVNRGISMVTRSWDMLNTKQYLEMRREAFKNDGITPTLENAPDLLIWDSTRYTDWQKVFWGNTGKSFGADLNISGGTPLMTYRLSGNYKTQSDIMQASGGNQVIGFNLSFNQTNANQKFKMGMVISYTYSKVDMIRSPDPATLPPNAPPIWDDKGELNFKDWNNTGLEGQIMQFTNLLKPFESKTNDIRTNLNLGYNLFKGFRIGTSLGFISSANNSLSLEPSFAQNPKDNPTGISIFGRTTGSSWTIDPMLNYNTSLWGLGNLTMIVGGTLNHSVKENADIVGGGYKDDNLLRSVSGAGFTQAFNTFSNYKYNAVFAQLDFSWDNKYILKLSGRRDGSSRFGPGKRFGNFGAVGAAWIISDENWMENVIPSFISLVKVRGNYGTTGKDGGGDYEYLSQWGRTTRSYNYNEVPPIINLHAVNQNYHWAVSKEVNLGFELGLLKNSKLRLSIDYYNTRLDDQLVQNKTPRFTGFASVFGNWAALVVNTRWDFRLSTIVGNEKGVQWIPSLNGGFNNNRLKSYPGIEYSEYYTDRLVGQPVTSRYLLKYLGVDPLTGRYQLKDYNNDGTLAKVPAGAPLSDLNDRHNVVDMNPSFLGGFSNDFRYKNFSLNLHFQFNIQKGENVYASFTSSQSPGVMMNIPLEVFNNRWQKPGDNARFERFTSRFGQSDMTSVSDLAVTDASFFRLNNIAFAYSMPEKLARKINMNAVAFTIAAQNIFVFTRYKGIDPESQQFGSMPPARIIDASLKFNF